MDHGLVYLYGGREYFSQHDLSSNPGWSRLVHWLGVDGV